MKERTAALQKAYAELEYRATHDALTGLPNLTTVIEALSKELSRSGRSGRSVAVMMVDIDHCKSTNDTHGNLAGDTVLKAIADRGGRSGPLLREGRRAQPCPAPRSRLTGHPAGR